MEKEDLEVVLQKVAKEVAVEKVLEVTQEHALKKGENYMSDIVRLRAKLLLGNGRVVKRSFIIKKELPGLAMSEVAKEYDIFNFEAMMYNKILKEMEHLMDEFEDTEEVVWCQLFDHGKDFLLFEDLKASGFVLADRKAGLDLDGAKYILHYLGKFHAMAKVLELRGIITRDMFKPFVCTSDRKFIKTIFHSGMVTFSKAIKEAWGPSWEIVAEKLNIPFEELVKKFKELGQVDETKFNVLNHGDIWPNNIMFKYNWKNQMSELRLLDFQLCHYNSCCFDLVFFLFYSLVPSIRLANMKDLLNFYHKSLTKNLDRYKYSGPRPTIEEIVAEVDRLSYLAYCLLFSEYPALVTDLMEGYEINKVVDDSDDCGYCIDVYKDKRLIEKLGPDLKLFVEKYLS